MPFFLRWYVLVTIIMILYGLALLYQDQFSENSSQATSSISSSNDGAKPAANEPTGKRLALQEETAVRAVKDCLINDLHVIAAYAFQYRLRPTSLGGGQGSYGGFVIPAKLKSNENATYHADVLSADIVLLSAHSTRHRTDKIGAHLDANGNLSAWSYEGNFSEVKGYSE